MVGVNFKGLYFGIFLLFVFESVFAQNQVIPDDIQSKWEQLAVHSVSDNGKYAFYSVLANEKYQGYLTSTDGSWSGTIGEVSDARFSSDSKCVLFVKNNTLIIRAIETGKEKSFPEVGGFRLIQSKKGDVIIAESPLKKNKFALIDLATQTSRELGGVEQIDGDEKSRYLFFHSTDAKSSETQLILFTVSTGLQKVAWKGVGDVMNCTVDAAGKQLVFQVKNNEHVRLWYLKIDQGVAKELAFKNPSLHNEVFELSEDQPKFDLKGEKLLLRFSLNKLVPKVDPTKAQVNVWNYKDTRLQSQQLKDPTPRETYAAIMDLDEKNIDLIEDRDMKLFSPAENNKWGSYLLLKKEIGDIHDNFWKKDSRQYFIYGVRTKTIEPLPGRIDDLNISPSDQYVVWTDRIDKTIYSYDIKAKVKQGIGKDITYSLFKNNREYDSPVPNSLYGSAGWDIEGKKLLMYDTYDIWSLDPSGIQPSVNLTNGYGRKHHLFLRIVDQQELRLSKGAEILLVGFNADTKDNGYLMLRPGSTNPVDSLVMGPYQYLLPQGLPTSSWATGSFEIPVKAKNVNVYLMPRESATAARNLYAFGTNRKLVKLSDISPQTEYNWYQTELLKAQSSDGNIGEAILYKPQDFDPTKHYPVIFTFYERSADGLHSFLAPQLSKDMINIPYFVSRGYLIVDVNIYYRIGHPGESALEAVNRMADLLSKRSYVDTARFGITGHSHGGFQTNYIITHSNRFRAALSAAGVADISAEYHSIRGFGFSNKFYYETVQGRIGKTIWEAPDLYLENSPIRNADKLQTPLLLMNNRGDGQVSFTQGTAFFTALQRLGKTGWLLEYDGEGHGISRDANKLDYTKRIEQFFDHYLKGTPAPVWMTRGIPASMKQVDDGFALDTINKP